MFSTEEIDNSEIKEIKSFNFTVRTFHPYYWHGFLDRLTTEEVYISCAFCLAQIKF